MTDTILTPAQKRAITRRANAEKRARLAAEREAEARRAAAQRLQQAEAAARKPYTRQDEATLLMMMERLADMLADCRAELAAAEARDRRQIARGPVVSLADYRGARSCAG